MRSLFSSALALVGLLALACTKPEPDIQPQTPGSAGGNSPTGTPTALGQPIGAAVTQTIGPDGGTLRSADGRVAVRFPAGALKTATAVSLQPVENTAPVEVSGPVVALLPADLALQKPVEVVFTNASGGRQTDEDGEGGGPWVSEQHPNGVWEAHPEASDSGAEVVVKVIRMNRFALFYPYTITKLNQSANGSLVPHEPMKLVVRRNFVSSVGAGKGVILRPLGQTPLSELIVDGDALRKVFVNGHDVGSADDGLTMIHFNEKDGYSIQYTAPGQTPKQSPVTVVATFDTPEGGRRSARTTISVTNDNAFTFRGAPLSDANASGSISSQGLSVSMGTPDGQRAFGFQIPRAATGTYPFERFKTTVSATSTGRFDDIWYQSYSVPGGENVDNGGSVTITGLEPVKGFPHLVYVRGEVTGRLSKPLPGDSHAYEHATVKASFALVIPKG